MDLEFKRPLRPLFRVGRDDDAWAVPDWAYAKEDGTFGNRFDDLRPVFGDIGRLAPRVARVTDAQPNARRHSANSIVAG